MRIVFSSLHNITAGRNLEFIRTCFFSSFFTSLGPISAVGKKEKRGTSQLASIRSPFFFSSLFPQCRAWSQARLSLVRTVRAVIRICAMILKVNATWCSSRGGVGGGGTSGNSWWGCVVRFSKSIPYFRPKNVFSQTRFQTRPLKPIPVFRPGL